MKVAIPPDWRYLPNVMDLIYLAEIDFLICEKVYSKYVGRESPHSGYNFLLLSANNAFNAAVEILYTLLCSTKKEELRIKPMLDETIKQNKGFSTSVDRKKAKKFTENFRKDYPNPDYLGYLFLTENDSRLVGDIIADIRRNRLVTEGLKDFSKLKAKFEKYDFHKIRHRAAAHKNKNLASPAGAARLLLKDGLIKNLGDVIKDLRINAYFWFNYQVANPYSFILDSLDSI